MTVKKSPPTSPSSNKDMSDELSKAMARRKGTLEGNPETTSKSPTTPPTTGKDVSDELGKAMARRNGAAGASPAVASTASTNVAAKNPGGSSLVTLSLLLNKAQETNADSTVTLKKSSVSSPTTNKDMSDELSRAMARRNGASGATSSTTPLQQAPGQNPSGPARSPGIDEGGGKGAELFRKMREAEKE